jgi:hypothetical protein
MRTDQTPFPSIADGQQNEGHSTVAGRGLLLPIANFPTVVSSIAGVSE